MSLSDSFAAYWWFHIPNLALAALVYTVVARYLLDLFFGGNRDIVIVRVFHTLTDPILQAVRFVTPAIVPNGLVVVFTVVWLMALRLFVFLTAVAVGMRATALGG
jgi:YggT family protein